MLNDFLVEEPKVGTHLGAIREFEKKYSIKLPESYIEWLLRYNGGHPIYDGYRLIEPIDAKNHESDVAWFYALYDGDVSNLEYELVVTRGRMPSNLIPIAYTSCGDQICICVGDVNYGKIYFWDYNNEGFDKNGNPWWDNVFLISNSFEEFINNLYQYDFDDSKENIIRTYQDGRVEMERRQKRQ